MPVIMRGVRDILRQHAGVIVVAARLVSLSAKNTLHRYAGTNNNILLHDINLKCCQSDKLVITRFYNQYVGMKFLETTLD